LIILKIFFSALEPKQERQPGHAAFHMPGRTFLGQSLLFI